MYLLLLVQQNSTATATAPGRSGRRGRRSARACESWTQPRARTEYMGRVLGMPGACPRNPASVALHPWPDHASGPCVCVSVSSSCATAGSSIISRSLHVCMRARSCPFRRHHHRASELLIILSLLQEEMNMSHGTSPASMRLRIMRSSEAR